MALDRLRATLIDAVSSGVPPEYEVEAAGRYEGQFRERQIDAAIRLFETQGVDRNDKAARAASMLHNFAFFGAPHAAFLFMPADGGLREARSEEHTSELPSLMRISYAIFCLNKKTTI